MGDFIPDPLEEANSLVYDMIYFLDILKDKGELNDGEYARVLDLIRRGRNFTKYD